MGSHRLREKPDLGDFKSPRDDTRSKPREPRPAAPAKPANDIAAPSSEMASTDVVSTETASTVIAVEETVAATPFQLSRIYAKGWQAGMISASEAPDFDADAAAEALNPCAAEAERDRWTQGFSEAIARKLRVPGRKPVAFRASTV